MKAHVNPMIHNQNARRSLKAIGLAIVLLFGLAWPAAAATGTLAPAPYLTVLNSNGAPVSGACIWTYSAGTTTPIATYTDVALAVANTNPIIADGAGRFVAFLSNGLSYKFLFEAACTPPAHGSVIRTQDNIAAVPTSSNSVDVTGVAGEALSAGNCAYLSDGSGAKTVGSWYKCDTANAYSSTTNVTGVVPVSISLAASGAIRLQGSVTGLTSLTVGALYYASTAGALTSTEPLTNRKLVGQADTTTTLTVVSNPPLLPFPTVSNGVQCFRLSLTTGVPVTTTDVTAATTVFATPFGCNRITLFDSIGTATTYTSAQFSIAVPATTSQVYDVFAFNSAGVATLELLAWTNDTTRATAIVLTTTGTYTKSGDLTRRYLGSMRTTAVSGQTEDSVTNRYLWNYYNRLDRALERFEGTASWAYNTNTIRQANAATANQVNVLVGVSEEAVVCDLLVTVTQAASTNNAAVGIGLDSTTTFAANQAVSIANMPGNSGAILKSQYRGFPGVGKHSLMWNEVAFTTVTTTFWGASAAVGGVATAATSHSGLLGVIKG